MKQIYARTAGALAMALAVLLASGPTIADDDKRGSGKDQRGAQHDQRGSGKDQRGSGKDQRGDQYDQRGSGKDQRGDQHDQRGDQYGTHNGGQDDHRGKRDDDDDGGRWSRNDDDDDDRGWSRNDDGHYHFADEHRVFVRDYYGKRGCPPGLAKKNNHCMPPGQTRAWKIGHRLPSNVIYHDVPQALVLQIGPPPTGYRYVRVASDILLMAAGTGMIMDAIQNLGGM